MTDQQTLPERVRALHETHVCRDCGAEITLPYATPSDAQRALDDLNGAYRERNALVAALIRVERFPAYVVSAPDAFGWLIVYVETPAGQLSWHFAPNDIDLFEIDGIDWSRTEYEWDGHTTDQKYARLALLASSQEPSLEARGFGPTPAAALLELASHLSQSEGQEPA